MYTSLQWYYEVYTHVHLDEAYHGKVVHIEQAQHFDLCLSSLI